jgi:RNA polymerase sigma-70 factor (ECF subfamily)
VADAEEIVQEAVLKALKGLPRFRQEAKFSTWLIQITLNEAKMTLRKYRRHLYESVDDSQYSRDGDYIPKDFADWREIPSEALEQKEIREALTKAVNSLPEKYRTVLVLRDIEKLTIAETAEALGISQANVKTRLSRGRLQLRDALAPSFGETRSRRRTLKKVRSLECDPTPVGLGTELRLATEDLDQPLALVTNVRTLDTIQFEEICVNA